MKQITLDQDTLDRLEAGGGLVEIRDESGVVAGYFAPRAIDRAAGYAAAAAAAHLYSPSATNGDPTYTTPEVIAYLESLGPR